MGKTTSVTPQGNLAAETSPQRGEDSTFNLPDMRDRETSPQRGEDLFLWCLKKMVEETSPQRWEDFNEVAVA